MRYYPLLFRLDQVQVLVVGAGAVGCRKATDILAASPKRLLWLDPGVSVDSLPDYLRSHPALVYEQREFRTEDAHGCGLVFAATSSRECNRRIADYCREHGVACNVADDPQNGSFIVPSYFSDGDFLLALSTSGHSPALAKTMRRELHEWYVEHYRPLLILLGRLRPLVLSSGKKTEQNTVLFRSLVQSRLNETLSRQDGAESRRMLEALLPQSLHKHVEELLHGLC